MISVFLSDRVPWRASWRHWGSSRKSFTLKASALTVPSEHTWSQHEVQPALGSGRWRHSGPGAWRLTRPCSLQEHRRAPCWRRSGLTSTLMIRCFTWKEQLRWAPSLPMCPMALHRNIIPNGTPVWGSSQQDLEVELRGLGNLEKMNLYWIVSGNISFPYSNNCVVRLSLCKLSQLNAIMLGVRYRSGWRSCRGLEPELI